MLKKPVGIGIIGTGFGGFVQLPAFSALTDACVIGIASKEGKKTDELRKKYKLPQSFESPEELISCSSVDLVSIAVPQAAHEPLVHAAIKAGKHILCEKPFTLSATQGQQLLDEAEAAGIIHAIDFEFRELPAVALLKKRVMSGSVGTIRSARLQWIVGTWADLQRTWHWQCDAQAGGGVLSALGVHLFDLAEWLCGDVTKLKATTGTKMKERPDENGQMKAVTSEDHASIEMMSADDASITIALSNVEKAGTGLMIEIVGDKSTLRLESASQEYGRGLSVKEIVDGTATVLLEAQDAPAGTDPRIPPFQTFAHRLVKALQENDTAFRPSFVEGVRTQLIREAVLASNDAWVEIGA